jgi:hypothetical protein
MLTWKGIPMRSSRPWFRKSTGTWFVCFNGKQGNLGADKDKAHETYRRMT